MTSTRVAETTLTYAARPAVRIEENPLPDLSNRELLAVLIGGGYASSDADLLLTAINGNLNLIYTASLDELARNYSGVGYRTAKRLKAALELGRRLAHPDLPSQISSVHESSAYLLRAGMGQLEQEEFWVINLTTKNKLLALSKLYRGNINCQIIRIAEVMREAVRHNSTAIIVAHNHPSGDPTPSPEDGYVTRSIIEAGKLLGIEVLDHLVIGRDQWISMKEKGLGGF